jgi:predicted esterase
MGTPHEHHVTVPRTARYYTLGAFGPETRAVWIVCHGYGNLAGEFIARFAPVDDGAHLIVAPEALNRYYHDTRPGASQTSLVGATWMTKEDRASEITDQITYLDTLYATIFRDVARDSVRVSVLGFSQGAATVARWLSHTRVPIDRAIFWAGAIPDDVSLAADSALRRADVVAVFGSRDEYATAERVARQEAAFKSADKSFAAIEFDGGHRLDDETLRALALNDGS